MRRIIQWLLSFAIGIFVLMVLAITGSFVYVYFNREAIISKVSETISRSINGELVTGKISIDIIHYFPATAIHISDVSIRDSLFRFHKMEFIHAGDVYFKINFLELFADRPAMENVTLQNGSLYIYNDRNGYSNKYLLRTKSTGNNSGFNSWLHKVNLKNFRFVFNDQAVGRYHNVFINKLECGILDGEKTLRLAIKSDGKIKMLAFNIKKGMYAKDASFNNNLIVYYNKSDSVLEIPEHTFYLNEQLVVAKATFRFSEPSQFIADLNAPRILFDESIKLVTAKTGKLLMKYKVKQPVRIAVHLEGSLSTGSLPLIKAELLAAGNMVTYKNYDFTNCRLQVMYTNQSDTSKPVSLSNNEILIKKFSGYWNGIPVNSDVIRFFNFPYPSVNATLFGSFPLRDFNKLPGGGLYKFSMGSGSYELIITAKSDSTSWDTDVKLGLIIEDGALVYEPRRMPFEDINANIIIKNNDVIIQSASCRSGTSLLSLKGKAPGLLNTDYKDLKSAILNWEIKSSYINLDDFTAFLGRRRKGLIKSGADVQPEKSDFGKHLERYLDACRLHMKLDIDALRFEKFTATGLSGTVSLTEDNWNLDAIHFNHAHGEVKLAGTVSPFGENKQGVSISTSLKHMNISEVFEAFDNFSQQTIVANQINGTLDADVQLNFNIDSRAFISQSSINGVVDLKIRDGELKGFQPMGKLSKFLFRKRDFTDIKFSELTNSFVAKGNEIYFDRMKINTSVMELYLEGRYFLDGKTDMRIQIPLSNLKSRNWDELSENITDHGGKGMNVFINASTDENGELRFRYDPLKKFKDKSLRR